MTTTTDENETSEPRDGPSLFWLVYGQIAAMLGAFSLLVFLTYFIDLGLKGVVREAFEVWTDYVRPFVGHPIQWLVDLLPPTWRFHISDFWKDYFAVGIVTAFATARAARVTANRVTAPLLRNDNAPVQLPGVVLLWPVFAALWLAMLPLALLGVGIGGRKRVPLMDVALMQGALILAPLLYLGLLFAANAWFA